MKWEPKTGGRTGTREREREKKKKRKKERFNKESNSVLPSKTLKELRV